MKTKISIVSAAYNEEDNISTLIREIKGGFRNLENYEYEIILVDDGSTDKTWEKIRNAAEKDKQIKGIKLSRNFGQQAALTAGLDYCSGEAVIYLDADLQHPPEKITDLINEWEKGAAVVHTRRITTREIPLLKKLSSKLFYKLMGFLSETTIEEGRTDFKLIDKTVLENIKDMRKKTRFLRGLIPWLGFETAEVEYKAPKRKRGSSKYTLRKKLSLAQDAILSFSTKPLKLISILGIILTLFSGTALVHNIILSLRKNAWYLSPVFTLLLGNTFIAGLILICLGIVAMYLIYLYRELSGRPIYIVESYTDEK